MFMALLKSCTIANSSALDGHRAPTLGTPATVACNYHLVEEMNDNGDNIIVSGWVILPTGTSVELDSQITINGQTPSIKSKKNIENLRTGEVKGIKLELGKGA